MVAFRVSELTPTALAAGQVSTARAEQTANLGAAVQGAADNFSQFYEKEAAIGRERLLAQAQADWARSYAERAKDAQPGFAKQFIGEYNAYIQNAMKSAPERGRQDLQLAFDKYGLQLETRAIEAEAAARARAKAKAEAEAKAARASALANEKRLRGNALVSDPTQLQEFMDADPKNADYYAKVALDARMMDDPVSVRDEMLGGNWDAYLSPSEKLAFVKGGNAAIERAEREAEAARAVERKSFEAAIDEEIAYAMANGAPPVDSVFSPEAVSVLYDGDDAAEIRRVYEQSIADAEMLYGVNTASVSDLNAQIETVVAAVQEPGRTEEDVRRLNSLQTAIQQRTAAINDDAAGFVTQISDEASLLFGIYESADPETRDISARSYVAALDYNYQRLGVPEDQRVVLPKQALQGYVQQFNEMAPDVAAQSLVQFAADWGDAAPRVLSQMSGAGLAPEYAVAMRHADNPGLAAQIVGLRGQSVAALSEGVPTLQVTTARQTLNENLTDYVAVFESGDVTGQATKIFNDNYGVAERLTLQKIRLGVDPAAAVEQVRQDMFPETVINQSNARIMLPPEFDEGVVTLALEQAQEEEALRAFNPAPMDDPRLPEFADEEIMIRAAMNGMWLTNSSGDGAVLHLNVGGYFIPVIDRSGNQYEKRFDALRPEYRNVTSGSSSRRDTLR
jgi:hypothetical protein